MSDHEERRVPAACCSSGQIGSEIFATQATRLGLARLMVIKNALRRSFNWCLAAFAFAGKRWLIWL